MFSPFETFEHLKENVCSYLETAYKVSNRPIFLERSEALRRKGVIAQDPFLESTPAFPSTEYLKDLIEQLEELPSGLQELASFGMPVGDFPLYSHQVEALKRSFSETPNLVVATGTGSGKTETFLLPILADILREAMTWQPPRGPASPGTYNSSQQTWLHSRRHENRLAGTRAIILYPMNALVNDQLQRLRRILGSAESENWQKEKLQGNVIHFGMYTGDAEPTGHWSKDKRRSEWNVSIQTMANTWDRLPKRHQKRGNWPRPNSPEMLCRWDMQFAPPDILITNYSMLEYMLARPLEARIFESTKSWLKRTPNAKLTLVLDEAHTYTGARGTEIAHLVRRLKERLGIETGDGKFRCIATSASLPSTSNADEKIRTFASNLFGESKSTFFTVVTPPTLLPPPAPTSNREIKAFADFGTNFNTLDPEPAIQKLALSLGLSLSEGETPSVALYKLLSNHPVIERARTLTTRKATQLETVSNILWGEIETDESRHSATTGVFSAGAFAREKDVFDAQPLISSRIHMMFRGLPGLWACLDPKCPKIASSHNIGIRPVGKIYTEPTPWCECGARVLEVLTCRFCGWMCLGGIPDNTTGSLWPWTDDLEGGRQDYGDYEIFGVESPHPNQNLSYRSIKTGSPVNIDHVDARAVYEITRANVNNTQIPFPANCPRCNNNRGRGLEGREIIEPLGTKGSKSFSVLVEDAYRLQPPTPNSETSNKGRKSLTFSDSRQDAAMLAGDLEIDHNRDLFRQMAYRLLVSCELCFGYGNLPQITPLLLNNAGQQTDNNEVCPSCNGSGNPRDGVDPIPVGHLRNRLMLFAQRAKIDPTLDSVQGYFGQLTEFFDPNENEARKYINSYIRNEIAAPDFGLEPMGLASWRATFPQLRIGKLNSLNESETDDLVEAIVRLLATEDVLLPPTSLDLRDWATDVVRKYDRNVLIPPKGTSGEQRKIFNPSGRNKLNRYLKSVGRKLEALNRFENGMTVEQWLQDITDPLFNVLQRLGILVPDSQNIGYGINIDRFQLEPLKEQVHICSACAYISNRVVLNICIRCGNETEKQLASEIHNYYRRTVVSAAPNQPYPDPFSIKVFEHSAQIEKAEARRFELRFQDVFVDNEDPDDARIDILSVTTTMEMGIDIGNLLGVGLRNVPPTVANYQQRAGRAGRRGSGVATVVTYAQNRSHDQYYFSDPPKIVTDPPRIPRLYLENSVIAQRHVRSLILQYFFLQWAPTQSGANVRGLLSAWGSVGDFNRSGGFENLRQWVQLHRATLFDRCRRIVDSTIQTELLDWIDNLPNEMASIIGNRSSAGDDILGALLDAGYLPRHAFPIDVVSLYTEPTPIGVSINYRERGIQRDLGIALSEFAPGAEIVRNKRIFQIVGLYNPFTLNLPNYLPEGRFVECRDCKAVTILSMTANPPVGCEVCGSARLLLMPYLRPPGFCSEWSGPTAGGSRYRGEGRDRVGSSSPAQLTVGEYAWDSPEATQVSFSPNLRVLVRQGDLYIMNRANDPQQPGFRICPQCGRNLGPTDTVHTYPADVPPHAGPNQGPRAGTQCRNNQPSLDRYIMGYRFPSEVIQFGIDLPETLDANMMQTSGKAVWFSYGTVLLNAASRVLQINPEEIRVGVRPVQRPGNRLHGEVFLYDTLPGGAGYSRDINEHLEEIMQQAYLDAQTCTDPECKGACYKCLLDYQNQRIHPILDRKLGFEMLNFLLNGVTPVLNGTTAVELIDHVRPFFPSNWSEQQPRNVGGHYVPLIVRNGNDELLGLLPRHTLAAEADINLQQQFLIQGIKCCSFTEFDLTKRPFWVAKQMELM